MADKQEEQIEQGKNLNLSTLEKKPGTKRRKRIGRGIGSGSGKTSGKGQKGQKARSGGAPPPSFEGGQLPLHRRVPKLKGFRPRPKAPCLEVNLNRLEATTLTDVNIDSLVQAGVVKVKRSERYYTLKVLGFGDITRALNVQCHAISQSAREKVEKAGGKVEILEKVYRNTRPAKEKKSA